jgi:hypothetical protein
MCPVGQNPPIFLFQLQMPEINPLKLRVKKFSSFIGKKPDGFPINVALLDKAAI